MWCDKFLKQPLYRVICYIGMIILAAPVMLAIAQQAIAQQELPDPLASSLVSEAQKAQLRLYEQQLERLTDIDAYVRRQINQLLERINALTVGEVSEALLQQAQVDTQKWRMRREELNHRINASEVRIKALERAIEDLEARTQLLQNPVRQQEKTVGIGGSSSLTVKHWHNGDSTSFSRKSVTISWP